MSELKAINAYQLTTNTEDSDVYIHNDEFGCGGDLVECYLKSEADKVIAELKAQKSQAEDDCAYWKMSEGNAVNAMHETEEYAMQLYNELRRQKYKRCLAMAKVCKLKRIDAADYRIPRRKWDFFDKWLKCWLELAEKFKEAK